jgi:ketosteroid isomerase-like protein
MAKVETGIRLALDFTAAANARDAARLSLLFEPEGCFYSESPGPEGESIRGQEEIRRYFDACFAAAPKACFEIEEAQGLGYRCVLRWSLRKERSGGDKSGMAEAPLRGVWLFVASPEGIREVHAYRKA